MVFQRILHIDKRNLKRYSKLKNVYQQTPCWCWYKVNTNTCTMITTAFTEQEHQYFSIFTFWVNGEAQARQALSGVAGLSRENEPAKPESERAAATASLMAKNTELPRQRMGSPMPCTARESHLDRLTDRNKELQLNRGVHHDLWPLRSRWRGGCGSLAADKRWSEAARHRSQGSYTETDLECTGAQRGKTSTPPECRDPNPAWMLLQSERRGGGEKKGRTGRWRKERKKVLSEKRIIKKRGNMEKDGTNK